MKPINDYTEVDRFVKTMKAKLATNEYKGGWSNCSLLWLLAKIQEEVGELASIIALIEECDGSTATSLIGKNYSRLELDEITEEAADVANIAMMIHDRVYRSLGHE